MSRRSGHLFADEDMRHSTTSGQNRQKTPSVRALATHISLGGPPFRGPRRKKPRPMLTPVKVGRGQPIDDVPPAPIGRRDMPRETPWISKSTRTALAASFNP